MHNFSKCPQRYLGWHPSKRGTPGPVPPQPCLSYTSGTKCMHWKMNEKLHQMIWTPRNNQLIFCYWGLQNMLVKHIWKKSVEKLLEVLNQPGLRNVFPSTSFDSTCDLFFFLLLFFNNRHLRMCWCQSPNILITAPSYTALWRRHILYLAFPMTVIPSNSLKQSAIAHGRPSAGLLCAVCGWHKCWLRGSIY